MSADNGMSISKARDPFAWAGIAITILGNIAALAWLAGKFDQRQTNTEVNIAEMKANIDKLETKAEKDAAQDVKIAVISEQLASISAGVGEIKGKLEQRR